MCLCLQIRGRERIKGLCGLGEISGGRGWRGTKAGCASIRGVGEVGAGKLLVLRGLLESKKTKGATEGVGRGGKSHPWVGSGSSVNGWKGHEGFGGFLALSFRALRWPRPSLLGSCGALVPPVETGGPDPGYFHGSFPECPSRFSSWPGIHKAQFTSCILSLSAR